MVSRCREKILYPAFGIFTILAFLYLNFNDHLNFALPVIVWNLPKMGFVGVNHTRFVLLQQEIPGSPATEKRFVCEWVAFLLVSGGKRVGAIEIQGPEMLKRGMTLRLSVCRTWAFSDGAGPNALQIKPGVFNERVFQALDYLLVEARRHRVRLILCLKEFESFWRKSTVCEIGGEAGTNVSSLRDPFFSDRTIKGYYKACVRYTDLDLEMEDTVLIIEPFC